MEKTEQIRLAMEAEGELLFLPENMQLQEKEKHMLIIVPTLDLNGTNTVLSEMLPIFKERYIIWILSPEAGEFGQRFHALGCGVFIKQTVWSDALFRSFLQTAFDLVFLNSFCVHYYALFFLNTSVPVLWWIHESAVQISIDQKNAIHLGLLSNNFTLLAVSKKVQNGLEDLYGCISYGFPGILKDYFKYGDDRCSQAPNEKIIFFIPGAYTYIKGQDILIRAVAGLPEDYRRKCRFVFAGYHLPEQEDYFQILKKMESLCNEIELYDVMPREEVYQWYQKSRCVIAASRIDSLPTTIIEAMMHQCLCVVSDGAGISDYITDGENGFVFENENVNELTEKLMYIILNYSCLEPVAMAGRKTYEANFSEQAGQNNFQEILSKNVKNADL